MEGVIEKLKKIKFMPTKVIIKKFFKKPVKVIYYSYRKRMTLIKKNQLKDYSFSDFKPANKFLYDINIMEQYVAELKILNKSNNVVLEANKILNHEFSFLGMNDRFIGEKIPWNKDFKTNFIWENNFYKYIKIINLSNNSDVKIPWELSRFQHIFTLGKAYWITGDEKYAVEFKQEIEDWIANNPIEYSVNWTCTMDVAIRAVNWICGYYFFYKSEIITQEFWNKFNKWLFLHGRFIYTNLENSGMHNNNHYLSDLVGLIWLGIYFGEFTVNSKKNRPAEWLKFGISELESEMRREVNKDGTNYEASTSYHRLVTELFLITAILCNKNDIHFSKEYSDKLEKMCEFIMDIVKPNGLCPVIGDADDGRLIIFSDYQIWNRRDFRHILAISGEYFDRNDFRFMGNCYQEDAIWTIGNYKRVNKEVELKSKIYDEGGYYILRNNNIYCIIRCGELSLRGLGGHSHNDQLSVELNFEGEDFVIDPGNYAYTSNVSLRNLYRQTRMHNTLYIEGYEQNEFNEYDLFYMREQSFGKCKAFDDKMFLGEHYGYKEKCGYIHKRKIQIKDYNLIIEDKLIKDKPLTGKKDTKMYLNFILDQGVDIIETVKGIDLVKNYKKVSIEFVGNYSIEETFISYKYGEQLSTKKISVQLTDEVSRVIFSLE